MNAAHFRIFVVALFLLPASSISMARASELEVRLFGQPCKLSGPQELAMLKAVHSISPEQALPEDLLTEFRPDRAAQLKTTLEKVKKAAPLPTTLDPYREKLKKRLNALIAFFEGYTVASKDRKASPLIERVRHSLPEQDLQAFSGLAKKAFATAPVKPVGNEVGEQLFSDYLLRIDADPEDDFHRSTRKLQITYDCALAEQEEEE